MILNCDTFLEAILQFGDHVAKTLSKFIFAKITISVKE